MALKTNETATLFAQKKLLGKAHTSNLNLDVNEAIGSNVQASTSLIFGEAIPTNPSLTLHQVQNSTVEYVEFALVSIAGSTYDANDSGGGAGSDSGESSQASGPHAYAFKFKSNYESVTNNSLAGNGNYDNNKIVHETLGAVQIVPPFYSREAVNPYVIKIYKDNGSGAVGDEIPILDDIDWQVDTYNGVLFVQDYNASKIPAFARAFIYVGSFADTVIAASGGSGGTVAGSDTQVQFNDGGSAFGGDSGLVFNKTTNTLTTDNISGSLTQLSDGNSYLVAGHNVTITSASNGQVTIASAITELSEDTSPALGGQLVTGDHKIAFGTGNNTSEIDFTYNGGGNFTAIASVKSIDMFLDLNGGDSGQKFRIFNNLQPRSSYAAGTNTDTNAIFMVREEGNVFTKGYITASMGFSGSLTKLNDGTNYILANGSITATTQSNGSIVLSAANSVFNEYIGEANGSNTRFTLAKTPTADKNISVFVNGQLQMPATDITGAPFQDYSVTGSVINFVTQSLPPVGSLLMANYTTNQSIS